jgi:hypothetical protein
MVANPRNSVNLRSSNSYLSHSIIFSLGANADILAFDWRPLRLPRLRLPTR